MCQLGFVGDRCQYKIENYMAKAKRFLRTIEEKRLSVNLFENVKIIINQNLEGQNSEELAQPGLNPELVIKPPSVCKNKCFGNGLCVKNLCACKDGFYGIDCSCDFKCFNGGQCLSGKCACPSDYFGLRCEYKMCHKNCAKQGLCVDGICKCRKGF